MKELNIKLTDNIGSCIVTLDGEPIGFIQSIKLDVNTEHPQPKIEIIFPDLRPYNDGSLPATLLNHLDDFLDMPHVTVKFKALELVKNIESGAASKGTSGE